MVNYGGGTVQNPIYSRELYSPHPIDEVSALVLDIGTSTLRAGYAGDDTPKAIIPTCYGFKKEPPTADADVQMDENPTEGEAPKQPAEGKTAMYIGNNGPSIWREDMEVAFPVRDGLSTLMNLH